MRRAEIAKTGRAKTAKTSPKEKAISHIYDFRLMGIEVADRQHNDIEMQVATKWNEFKTRT